MSIVKCPIPGCPYGDRGISSTAAYCPGCGLSILRFFDAAAEWVAICEQMASEDPAIHRYLSSPRDFRLAHPFIVFFRCWNCDRFQEREMPPLTSYPNGPEAFLQNSAKVGHYLPGRNREYHSSVGVQPASAPTLADCTARLDYHVKNHPEIPPSPFSDFYEAKEWRKEFLPQHLERCEAWDARNDALEAELRGLERAVESEKAEIQRTIDRELSDTPTACAHKECPVCGVQFSMVLRAECDLRYLDDHRQPLTSVEEWLYVPVHNEQTAREAIHFYFEESGLEPNRRYILHLEEKFGFQLILEPQKPLEEQTTSDAEEACQESPPLDVENPDPTQAELEAMFASMGLSVLDTRPTNVGASDKTAEKPESASSPRPIDWTKGSSQPERAALFPSSRHSVEEEGFWAGVLRRVRTWLGS